MRKTITAATVAALALLGACGDDNDDDGAGEQVARPASTEAAPPDTSSAPTSGSASTLATVPTSGGSEGADEAPQAIVSLAPTHTEILFAIGAGDQVIAVDDQSNFPPEADAVRTGLSGWEPNVEAIAGYEPDLVVMSEPIVEDQLEDLGIDVWIGPAAKTLDEAYAQIEELGALTGHEAEAAELVAEMQAEIEEVTSSVTAPAESLTVFHELDDTGFTVDSTTFVGAVYEAFGLHNIADEAEGDHGGYPQLNAETIIAADPDLIFLADIKCCGQSAEIVAARPGWNSISAVANDRIFEVDEDIASRWGPRVVDYYRQIADALATVTAGG